MFQYTSPSAPGLFEEEVVQAVVLWSWCFTPSIRELDVMMAPGVPGRGNSGSSSSSRHKPPKWRFNNGLEYWGSATPDAGKGGAKRPLCVSYAPPPNGP